MVRYPVQELAADAQNRFIFAEVNSTFEEVGGPNRLKMKK